MSAHPYPLCTSLLLSATGLAAIFAVGCGDPPPERADDPVAATEPEPAPESDPESPPEPEASPEPSPEPEASPEPEGSPDPEIPCDDAGLLANGDCRPDPPASTPMDLCPSGELVLGICAPEPPRGTPAELCPSGRLAQSGICEPQMPALTPWACPEGWSPLVHGQGERVGHGCAPPLVEEPCPAGSMPLVGQSACAPMGLACPPEGQRWHDEATLRQRAPGYDGQILLIDASAPYDGLNDGSAEHPHTYLQNAILAAEPGDILAMAGGDYVWATVVERDVAIVGACTAQTRLHPHEPQSGAPTLWFSSSALVTDLSVTGSRRGVMIQQTEGRVTLDAVRVFDATDVGVLTTNGADVTLRRVLIEGTLPRPEDQRFGIGLSVQGGSNVLADDLAVLDNRHFGVLVTQDSDLTITDALIARTQPKASDQTGGQGLYVTREGRAEASRVVLRDNHDDGALVADLGSTLSLTDALIEGTRASPGNLDRGFGLTAVEGPQVTLTRALIRDNRWVGILAGDPGTTLDATDLTVAGTLPQLDDGTEGKGLHLQDEAVAVLRRVALIDNHLAGLGAFSRSDLTLEDALIAGTLPQQSDRRGGQGAVISQGARLSATRLAIFDAHTNGILAHGAGTALQITELTIEDIEPEASDDELGRGLELHTGATATVERARVAHTYENGMQISGIGTRLDLTDALILDTRPQRSSGFAGMGLRIQEAALVNLLRVHVEGSREIGVLVFRRGTRLNAADLTVTGTLPREADLGVGHGLNVQQSGSARVLRGRFTDNHTANVMVTGEESSVELTDTEMSGGRPHAAFEGFGLGFFATNGSTATLTRCALNRNREIGLLVTDAADVALVDLLIADTLPPQDGGGLGYGMAAVFEAQVSVDRAAIARSHAVGLLITSEGTRLSARDLRVVDTRSQQIDLEFGRGVEINSGADVDLERVVVEGARQVGIMAQDLDTTLSLTHALIQDILPAECDADGSCIDFAGGSGLTILNGADAALEHFVVTRNAQVGVQIATEAHINASDGVVSNNRIGVNLQVPNLDLTTSFRDVRVLSNGRDLDATEASTPSAANAIESLEDLAEEDAAP